jgi:hypothetical protein
MFSHLIIGMIINENILFNFFGYECNTLSKKLNPFRISTWGYLQSVTAVTTDGLLLTPPDLQTKRGCWMWNWCKWCQSLLIIEACEPLYRYEVLVAGHCSNSQCVTFLLLKDSAVSWTAVLLCLPYPMNMLCGAGKRMAIY